MTMLVRLYPRAWRDRYEEEFLGLLAVRPPSNRDRVDILRGALDARRNPGMRGPDGAESAFNRPARRLALISALAGVSWLAWMAVLQLTFDGWGGVQEPDFGILAFTPVVANLAMAVAHAALVLAAASTMRHGAVLAASLTAVLFGFAALGVGMIALAALIGSAIVAFDGIGRVLPAWFRLAWIVSVVSVIVTFLGFVGGGGRDVALLVGGMPFGSVWLFIAAFVAVRGIPASDVVPVADPNATATGR